MRPQRARKSSPSTKAPYSTSCTAPQPFIARTTIRGKYKSALCCRSRPAAVLKIVAIALSQPTSIRASNAKTCCRLDAVREAAERASAAGSTRFCMGAAWRQVRDGAEFRPRAGHGARGCRYRHGSLLHVGHAHRRSSPPAARSRPPRVQPQPRHRGKTTTPKSSPPAPIATASKP